MADKRISQLNSHTTPSGSDLLVIVNNNETKKITYADLTATITGSQTDLTPLNQFTQSFSSFSSSVHTEILAGTNEQDLSNLVTNVTLGILSGSVDSRLDNLEANTGSFATTGSNNFTGYQSALAFNADDITANSTAYIRNLNGIAGTTISVSSNVEFFNGLTGSIGATNGVVSGSNQIRNLGFATTGSNTFRGNQIISGTLDVFIPQQRASGQNENPTPNNIFWSYPTQDVNTRNVEIGWTASVQDGGTYSVTNVEYDTPYAPFISITLDNPDLTLGYRTIVNFTYGSDTLFNINSEGLTFPDNTIQTTAYTGVNTGSFAITGSNIFIGEEIISGSLILSSSVPATLAGAEGDKKGTITFDENYLYYCFADYTGNVGGGGGATHLFDAQGGIGWNSYGDNYLSVGFSQEGEAVPPVAGWYFIDDNGDVKQLLSDPLWFSGGNPSPYPNGAGWMAVVDSLFVYSDSNPTITFYESNPGGVASDIWKKISLNTISGLISGSQQITDLGFISSSADIADFIFTSQTITNSSITLQSTSGDIVLNADGNVYKGSASAGNGLVTDGYLGVIIGDESRINTGTGHSITDNLDNIINSIPSISSLNSFTSSYFTDSASIDSRVLTEKGRIDAILSASTANADTFAEIVTLINSVDTTNDNAFATYYTSSNARISSLENNTSSYETKGSGIVSGSSQLTSSFDVRYALSASYLTSLNGAFSSSIQTLGGSGVYSSSEQLPTGLVSGSSQISTWGYTTTSSFNSFTASYTTDSSSFDTRITAVSSGSVSVINDIVHNGETFTIQKGTPVYVSGSQGANPIVYVADASNPNKMPVTYIAGGNITTNSTGVGILLGDISGIDLTGYLPGQQVYVAEGGGWSINPPSGSSSIKQFLGIITKEGNGGKGLVLNPGPAVLPNLQTGYIWVGNTNNQASTMMTASFVFTSSYNAASASFDSRISSLVSAGVPAGTVSGSSQLTASYDTRYTLSGSVQSVTLPSGLISSSAQLPSGLISGSSQLPSGLVSGSSQLTSSYDVRYALSASYLTSLNGAFSSSTQLPSDIVSGSSQLTSSYDTRYTLSSSYNIDSSSFNTQISNLVNNTSSYETTGRGIISQSVVTISGTAPSVNTGNLWYDNNIGNLYLKYDTNTWIDTSNGVIQSIISDGTLATTGSNQFNGNQSISGSLIVSGSTTFRNNITIGTGSGAEGGEIDLAYAQSSNTTLTGSSVAIDVYGDKVRIFEGGGNSRGVFVDLSKAPTGVGGELTWRTSGIVNAGTFVQMDNIKATVTTSGNRGLSLATVSGTISGYISGHFQGSVVGNGGGAAGLSLSTTPTTSIFGWGFGQEGDTSQYIVRDNTNTRFYRIVLIIGGAYNNNFISIERLY